MVTGTGATVDAARTPPYARRGSFRRRASVPVDIGNKLISGTSQLLVGWGWLNSMPPRRRHRNSPIVRLSLCARGKICGGNVTPKAMPSEIVVACLRI